jgi:VanZ family protein
VTTGTTALTAASPSASAARAWLLVALWAALIWWLGTDQFGAGSTSRFLFPLIRWLWPSGTPAEHIAVLFAIRKLAHPAVYGVLAALAFRAALLSGMPGLMRGAAVALAIAIGIAGLDELRQSHSAARTGAPTDVMLDAAGASAAIAALHAFRRRTRPAVVA